MSRPSSGSPFKWWSGVVVIGGSLAVAGLVIVTGPKTEPEEKVRPPKIVKTLDVRPSNYRIDLSAHGTVIPVRRVEIEPQVTGQIVRHHPALVPGGYVQEGDELFAIDPTLMELSIKESIAAVARAEAMLTESQRKEAEAKQLALEQVIAESELAAIASEVQIQTAELQRLNASLERTRELLNRHRVHAPFNAVVLDESVEIGQRVDPGFSAVTLVGTDEFWVRAVTPVDQLRWIKLPKSGQAGAEADVYLDTGNGLFEHRPGQVVQLLSDMEEVGRMPRVLIKIRDPLGLETEEPRVPLLIGSYVRVEIDAGELDGVLAIDRTALREGDRIWVVDPDGQLQIRDAVVRWRKQETVYIDNALNPGETLIVSALRVALPGMKVEAQLSEKTTPNPFELTAHEP